MFVRMASFFALAASLGGCALSAITSVHETFPGEKNLVQACRMYYGGDFDHIVKDIAIQQNAGWKVRLTGYDHSDIWICYEKRLAETSSNPAANPATAPAPAPQAVE